MNESEKLQPIISRFATIRARAESNTLAFADIRYGDITICNVRVERDPLGNPAVIFPSKYDARRGQPVQYFTFANTETHRLFAGLVLAEYRRRTEGKRA